MKLKLLTPYPIATALVGPLNNKAGTTFLRYILASELGAGSTWFAPGSGE